MDDAVVVNEVFEATVEENLIAPTFVIDYPAALCPLARRKKDNPSGVYAILPAWRLAHLLIISHEGYDRQSGGDDRTAGA